MNSNEEYLDNLLKSIEQKENALKESEQSIEPQDVVDSELVTGSDVLMGDPNRPMSPEEIEAMLAHAEEINGTQEEPDEKAANMDLDDLLKSMSDNEDLAEIQTLFEKADNDEPVSGEVEELLKPETDLEEALSEDTTDAPKEKRKFFGKKGIKGLFSKKEKKQKNKSDFEAVIPDEAPADVERTGMIDWADVAIPDQDETDATDQLETDAVDQVESDAADQLETDLAAQDEADLADISDLLASLNDVGEESNFDGAGIQLFTPEDPAAEPEQVADLLGDLQEDSENDEQLQDISERDDDKDNKDKKDKKEKKKGVFARLLQFLTEEDEEEEKTPDDALSELFEGIETLGITSDENQEALAQLDQEDQKGKKKKKKKGKKADQEKNDVAEGDRDEDEEPKEEKKKKKPKKEKKQKAPKIVDDTPTPKLPKKKVRATFLFAFTVMAAIMACCLFIPELFEMREARNAYYEGDYETCYRSLYGKKLSESDQIMFERSEFMMLLQRSMDSYESYLAVGDELRALDALLQKVASQAEVMEMAQKNGLTAEAEASYQEIWQLLSDRYQLSEEETLKICAYEQDALYTLHLKAIVAGEEFVCPDYLRENGTGDYDVQADQEETVEAPLEDVLPAEEELTETEFEEGTDEP